jgi:hypothetical protein
MLLLCDEHTRMFLISSNLVESAPTEFNTCNANVKNVIIAEFGRSEEIQRTTQKILNDAVKAAISENNEKPYVEDFHIAVRSFAINNLFLYYCSLHPNFAEEMLVDGEETSTATSELPTSTYADRKRNVGSYLEVASLAHSTSRKKQKTLVDPDFSWYQNVQAESSSKNLQLFSASVETVRRGILGLTIDDVVLIPKNFSACFGQTAGTLQILMDHLKIKTLEGPIILEPTKYIWCRVFNNPTQESLEELKRADSEKTISLAVLNLMEAVDFITQPRMLVDSRPGLDYVRFLMCEAHQNKYENKLQNVEASFKYTSKTQKVFEDSLMALTPNLGDVPRYLCSMLKRIVQYIFSAPEGEKARVALCSIIESFYIEDRSIVARSYNTAIKKKLNAEGKKVALRKGKLADRHYDSYKAIVKPTIDTAKMPLTNEELTVVKKVNQQLQTLETHCVLPETLNQKLRKSAAKDLISLYHEKCRSVERVYASRRQRIHNELKRQRTVVLDTIKASDKDRQEDKNIPFSTEEWKRVTVSLLKTDDSLIEALTNEFRLENGLVAFTAINAKFFGQMTGNKV